jgi:hypothetical protein
MIEDQRPSHTESKSHEINRAREREIKPVSKLASHGIVNFSIRSGVSRGCDDNRQRN